MRLLGRDDVEKIVGMRDAIAIMRTVFPELTNRNGIVPGRTVITLANSRDAILFMPGYLPEAKGIGLKISSVFPANPQRGIPTITAQIILNNHETGEVECIMDGGYITALRTGATVAVATDLLARKNARQLGIFGAGVQARTQIQGVLEVRNIRKVLIHDHSRAKAAGLVGELKSASPGDCAFEVAETPGDAVAGSDIIVTATTSRVPVFDGNQLSSGTHVNSIGSFTPDVREVDDATVRRARIFVEAGDLTVREAGDLIIPLDNGTISREHIIADLGELLLGLKKGRVSEEDITYFKSTGMSLEDIAVGTWVYAQAQERNLGIEVA